MSLHFLNKPSCALLLAVYQPCASPFATDVLQRQGMDIAIPEHGPGWLTLLQRDYSWRQTRLSRLEL